jgi:hypothetical protein
MLTFLRERAISERKLRLFAVACCLRVFPLLEDKPAARKALDYAERVADGTESARALRGTPWGRSGGAWPAVLFRAWESANTAVQFARERAESAAGGDDKATTARWRAAFQEAWGNGATPGEAHAAANQAVGEAVEWLAARETAQRQEAQAQASLLRCIFGPLPFRPVTIQPSLLTGNVVKLAESIYQERAFDRMGVLADALEDAGCTDQDVLTHLRQQESVHVRGCWVIDLILAKQ